jgi:hypothetical protein
MGIAPGREAELILVKSPARPGGILRQAMYAVLEAMRSGAGPLFGKAPRVLLALLIAALGVLALHPFCGLARTSPAHEGPPLALGDTAGLAAEHPQPAGLPSGRCCEGFASATVVKSADPLVPLLPAGVLGAIVAGFAGLLRFARAPFEAKPFPAFPPQPSFYARSARILR